MKKIYILLCALAALAAASCTEKEELAPSFTGEKVTREFSTVLTKTTLHTDGATVYWEADDAISVFDAPGSNNKFTIKDYTAPSASATFSGEVDAAATEFYAVYPHDAGNALAGSTLTAAVPASQTLKAGSFQSGAAVAVAYTKGTSLAFHQATAILQVTLDTDMYNVESIEFYGNNNEYVAGAFEVEMNTSTGAITSVTPGTGSKKVALTKGEGTFVAGQTYYLSFIPQDFTNGVTVLVNFDGDKTGIVTSSKRLETVAGTNYQIANFTRISLPKATFAAKNSFNYDNGTPQDLDPESKANIASIDVDSKPAGWDIEWNTDHFEVTPPTQSEIQATPQTVVPEGVFAVTLRSAAGHSRQVEIPVRLKGINNVDDLLAFRDLHGATGTLDASKIAALSTSCADYLVSGNLMLNADITLARSTMYSAIPAYFIHHLYVPLNGNNRTITADYKSNLAVCALFQYLHENVGNLNIAGTFESEYTSGVAHLASLAHYASKDGIVIDNVNSTATLKYNSGNGGNIGGIIVRVDNGCAVTVSNCTFDGTINVYNGVDKLGGVIGFGTLDNGAKRTDVDNCTFSGTINYSSTTHNNSRIGGIMGSNERNGQITNCISSGDININLFGTTMVDSDLRGVGGILGRCNAAATGYTMATTVNNSVFSGTITVTNGPSENSANYNKIIGKDLLPATQSGNDGSLGTIDLGGAVAGALSFGDASTVSFAYGETKVFDITTNGSVSGVDMSSLPAGWTVDCSAWSTGKVSVTAPERDAIIGNTAVGIGNVVLNATLTDASVVAADNAKSVRLYGINSLDEFKAFRTAHGATQNSEASVDKTTLIEWLSEGNSDGSLLLNTNLTLAKTDLTSNAFFMRTCYVPIEGNGKTITFNNITSDATRLALFQGILYDVSNLKFAGSLTIEKSSESVDTDAWISSLSTLLSKNATISNVESSVAMAVKKGTDASYTKVVAGGIIGKIDKVDDASPTGATFTDCKFTGSITMDRTSYWVGGIVGGIGNHVITVTLDNCDCSANITANRTAFALGGILGNGGAGSSGGNSTTAVLTNCDYTGTITATYSYTAIALRLGGIMGNCERRAELTNCTVSGGSINVDTNEILFYTTGARAIGGVIGRRGAQVSGHDMTTLIKGCSMADNIIISNANASETETANGETDAAKQGISVVVGNNRAPANSSLAEGEKGRFYNDTSVTGTVSITKK